MCEPTGVLDVEQAAGSCLVCHRLKVQVLLRVFFSSFFSPFQFIFSSFVLFSFNPSIVFPFLFFPLSLFFPSYLTFSYSLPFLSSFLVFCSPSLLLVSLYFFSTPSTKISTSCCDSLQYYNNRYRFIPPHLLSV